MIADDTTLTIDACSSNLEDFREHVRTDAPDLAVLDLMPEITTDVLKELRTLAPECKLILWTDAISGDFALQALTIGIRGVLGKSLSLEAYGQCLHRVSSGEIWFEKTLMETLRDAHRVWLTRRESQLIALLSRGLKNREISHELGLTEGTVKVYLSHLLRKSGVKNRFALALQCLDNLSLPGNTTVGQAQLRSIIITPFRDQLRRD